jgi:hypothetical protein
MMDSSDKRDRSRDTQRRPEDPKKIKLPPKPQVVISTPSFLRKQPYVIPQRKPFEEEVSEEEEAESDEEEPPSQVDRRPSTPPPRVFDKIQPVERVPQPRDSVLPRSVIPEDKGASKSKKVHSENVKKASTENLQNVETKRYKQRVIQDLIDQMMANPASVCLNKLTASEEFRKALLRRVRNKHVRTKNYKAFLQTLDYPIKDSTAAEEPFDEEAEFVKVDNIETVDSFETLEEEEDGLEAGSVVHRDVVEVYRTELDSEEKQKVVIVAGLSEGLRCVFPEVNGSTERVEAVIDGGSQIIAIDAWVAQGLGLQWDPNSVIHMQSANGQLKPTLGVCRNVPFKFGEVTVYLQLHVVEKAPFQILLGRPFDVLTESKVQNFKDGDQWVTVSCPNKGIQSVIPTYMRGEGIKIKPKREPTLRTQSSEEAQKEREQRGTESSNFQSTLMN